jgi:hypothetical protein
MLVTSYNPKITISNIRGGFFSFLGRVGVPHLPDSLYLANLLLVHCARLAELDFGAELQDYLRSVRQAPR